MKTKKQKRGSKTSVIGPYFGAMATSGYAVIGNTRFPAGANVIYNLSPLFESNS